MDNPEDQVYLGHMLDMARKAVNALHGKSRAEYEADEILRMGLTHLVQVIGEAARRVSQETRDRHPQIPWREMTSMRNLVIHEYDIVDFQ